MTSFAMAFWKDGVICPYCGSKKVSRYLSSERYQCYSCFTAFTSTTGTIAHRTHLDFSVWAEAISILAVNPKTSVRALAGKLKVSTKTAHRLKKVINSADPNSRLQANSILIEGVKNDYE